MSIQSLFDSFRNKKVAVIGDVMVDSYLIGNVNRISPEAPVPVVNLNRRETRLGGAANVAMNIKSLGAVPIMCSVVGDDEDADTFIDLLRKIEVPENGIIKSQNRSTTIKHRILSGNQQLLRVDIEDTHSLSEIDEKTLGNLINNIIQDCDLIIFEDYDKGTISENLIASTITSAKKLGIPVAVDPKKDNFLSYKGASLFKPNLKELKEGLGIEFDHLDHEQLNDAIEKLDDQLRAENYLITLSEHGVFYKSIDTNGNHPAHLRSISDVSGAGDTVISIAGLAISSGMPIEFASELANLGGGIVCESPGVVPIDSERLMREASSNSLLKKYF